jgi:gluconolactonase
MRVAMQWSCLAWVLAVAGPGLCRGDELPKPTGEAIVAPDAKLEHLWTRSLPIKGGLSEGPTVARDGSIYFSDIPMGPDAGKIMRFDPKTKSVSVFAEDSRKSNGLKLDPNGYLVACEGADDGGRGIGRWNLATRQHTIVVDRYQGKRFNAPNDLCVDSKGRIYFSDPKYVGKEPRELDVRAVYRVDIDGAVIEATRNVEKPNGLVLSPDEKTLFVADNNNNADDVTSGEKSKPGAMKIYSFALDEKGLPKGERKTIYDFGTEPGCDGMCVDAAGNVYLTSRSPKRPGVLVVDPTGKEVAFIPTGHSQPLDAAEPKGLPSNVTFGIGDDLNLLYITVDKSLYRVRLKAKGFHHVAR